MRNLAPVAFMLFVFWTWLIVIPDFFVWLVTGQTISGIPYSSDRGLMLIGWPVFWVVAAFCVGNAG